MILSTVQLACIAVMAFAGAGAGYQRISEKIDEEKYPPIGQMIDIGSRKLHVKSAGEEFKNRNLTVILEYGINADTTIWADIQSEISKFAHVYSYDRAGLGWSEESSEPRTAENIVKDLHALLGKVGNSSDRYIFVGHSFGGLIGQLYATTYPEEIAGMLLIDSAHEAMLDEVPPKMLQAWQSKSFQLAFVQSLLVPLGLFRWNNKEVVKKEVIRINHPHDYVDMRVANVCKSKYLRTYYSEVSNMGTSFDQVKNSSRLFGDIPLTVLIAGKLEDVSAYGSGHLDDYDDATKQSFIAMCYRHKNEQAARSTQGTLRVAEKSSHRIPFEQPELIVDCIRDLVENVEK